MAERREQQPSIREFFQTSHPVNQVRERFDGRWVLVRVTTFDPLHVYTEGIVVTSSATRRSKITRALARESALNPEPKPHYEIFRAHPIITSGPEVELATDKLVEQFRSAQAAGWK